MGSKLWQNIKHVPSTISGICLVIVGGLQVPQVQQICSLSPALASKVATASLWASGIAAIIALGQQTFSGIKTPDAAQIKKALCVIVCFGLLSLSAGCAKVVTIPAPNALPAPPDVTEQIKAVVASNIDPAQKPGVLANIQQTAKDQYALANKTHSDEYNAQLARASDAAKNINSWVSTAIQLVLGTAGLGTAVAVLVKK